MIELLKLLLSEYWKIRPQLINTESGFENKIRGKHAALVIGDRAFELNTRYRYIYDLSAIWKQLTGFPFVFATWVANRKLPKDFIVTFNMALEYGLQHMEKAINLEAINYPNYNNFSNYLNNRISYILDAEKKKGLALFLNKINS